MRPGAQWAIARGELGNEIAHRIKEAERSLSAGTLEAKEIRNIITAVLAERQIIEGIAIGKRLATLLRQRANTMGGGWSQWDHDALKALEAWDDFLLALDDPST